jgi:membrane protease YdiL (CAAX protease family)
MPAPSVAGRIVTVASALVLIAVAMLLVQLHTDEPLAGLESPERALALIVGRTMDLEAALAGAPAWERRLYALTLTDADSEIGQAIDWYDELAADSLTPEIDLRLAILLGEGGRRERLEQTLRHWRTRGEPLASHGQVVAAAYLGADALDIAGASQTLGALGPGWFADVLALRVATRLDDPMVAATARAAIAARAGPLLWRLRAIATLDIGLTVLGIVALRALRRRPSDGWPAVAEAPLPPPWSLGAGLAALVRGGALAALVLLTLLVGGHWLAVQPLLIDALDQPLMYLPLLLLVWRTLLAPAGLGFVTAFGLRPRAAGWRPCMHATLALVAAGIAIDLGLGLLGGPLGLTSHWSEWFDEGLAWGSPRAVAVTLLGSIVFAPIFEELVFRGLLYGTLRARLGWPLAAVGSALVFALAHGYGVAGLLSVFLSGLLWAWVYERTGSLLAPILAHVVNNAAVAVALTALLR